MTTDQFQFIVETPIGIYRSSHLMDASAKAELQEALEEMDELLFLKLDVQRESPLGSTSNLLYMGKGMIQSSVFIIEKVIE
mgnify:CR=1 FL=1